ncbi:MAG: type II toxin-antitoxin system VapC family toxin [Thermoplasmata archaeon]|nr:type II toxin-antitoxin system VapC family toxin [Thermoplasmata archaeon]
MKFLDANVFIYAFYKPKGKLTEKQAWMKEKAKEIITKLVNGNEQFLTTIVHISEMTNILKKALSLKDLHSILLTLHALENLEIVSITKEDYMMAVELMNEYKMDPNDCLAIYIMNKRGIEEIYSFDKDFDNVERIARLP